MSHDGQYERSTLMILGESNAKDWFYKGEGAANLVLGYCGSSPFLVGKVLRIQKIPNTKTLSANKGLALSSHERLIWKDVGEILESTSRDFAARAFIQHVMTDLLNSKHIDAGILIYVSKEFLDDIERNIKSQRPAWRVDAANINKLCEFALLISDHSVITSTPKCDFSIAVEIKPKCGFLPSSEYITEANAIKKNVTRFKMHQFLKHHRGEILQISGYNPLDLFSGSRDRILLAITALFASPQNNFRIFFDGSLVFGGLGGGLDNTTEQFNKRKEAIANLIISSGLQLASFFELIAETGSRSGIFDRLLATQKLDVLDIEGAIHLYYNIISQPCPVCKNLSNMKVLHKYSSLHSLPLEKSLKIVREYLIAATAKDCSLMISFRPSELGCPTSNYDSVFLRSSNQTYAYKAFFIDLDLKPLDKIVHYYELDQKIVNFYKMNQEIERK